MGEAEQRLTAMITLNYNVQHFIENEPVKKLVQMLKVSLLICATDALIKEGWK